MFDKTVGPKDTKWLQYYLGIPKSTLGRRLAGDHISCRRGVIQI